MPAVRASKAVRATRAALQQSTTTPSTRRFTASARTSASHGPQYDPPTGWLFGVKPGEKYEKEGWETPFFYGFCGSILLAGVAYGFKPDTSWVLSPWLSSPASTVPSLTALTGYKLGLSRRLDGG